jgi:hypothetical protein
MKMWKLIHVAECEVVRNSEEKKKKKESFETTKNESSGSQI